MDRILLRRDYCISSWDAHTFLLSLFSNLRFLGSELSLRGRLVWSNKAGFQGIVLALSLWEPHSSLRAALGLYEGYKATLGTILSRIFRYARNHHQSYMFLIAVVVEEYY
jgi:hypothetical protein